jgi:tRNA 2-selenouridine synthase
MMEFLSPREVDFLGLLLERTPLMDVRAPVEFDKGSIPGATNLPLLNDEERAAVGTEYKLNGQNAAIALGHRFLDGETKRNRIEAWASFVERNPNARVFCFRGGLRSRSVARALMFERKMDIPVIEGGYKWMRNVLLKVVEEAPRAFEYKVISGYTGSGKTRVLARLGKCAIDLEGLAAHRGSAFGNLKTGQPSQVDFESQLALALTELLEQKRRALIVEDESRTIGKITIPYSVFEPMERAPIYVLEKSPADRARDLVEVYLSENYDLKSGESDEEKITQLGRDVRQALMSISKKLGGLEARKMSEMFESALVQHSRTGDVSAHFEWTERLLVLYYDQFYRKHLERNTERIVFRGSEDELIERLLSETEEAK